MILCLSSGNTFIFLDVAFPSLLMPLNKTFVSKVNNSSLKKKEVVLYPCPISLLSELLSTFLMVSSSIYLISKTLGWGSVYKNCNCLEIIL